MGSTAWDCYSDDAEDADRAKENLAISALPTDAMEQIDAIQTRQRFNLVTGTGIPGFIAKGN